jgi:hypothetical protein
VHLPVLPLLCFCVRVCVCVRACVVVVVIAMGAVASATSSEQALFCYRCQQTKYTARLPRAGGSAPIYACPTCSSDFVQVVTASCVMSLVLQFAVSLLRTTATCGCPAPAKILNLRGKRGSGCREGAR